MAQSQTTSHLAWVLPREPGGAKDEAGEVHERPRRLVEESGLGHEAGDELQRHDEQRKGRGVSLRQQ